MPSRLILALALSLAIHGSLLFADSLKRLAAAPPKPALQATLRLPPQVDPIPAEPMLKNTLDTKTQEKPPEAAPETKPPPPKELKRAITPREAKRDTAIAQKKLSEHLFYPEEAVNRNLEGEVRLIIKLSETGQVLDVQVGSSSGHAILDKAAIKAAYAAGKFPNSASQEIIVPVRFYLQ